MAENNIVQGAAKNINKGQATREEAAKRKIQQSFLKHLLYKTDKKTGEMTENPTVTDISFNGTELYVQDNDIGRYKVDSPYDPRIIAGEKPLNVTASDVVSLGNNVQNVMGVQWNNAEPILDVELGELRTNFMNINVSPYGETFALRVSRPRLAITDIANLCDEDTAQLLSVFMQTGMNLLISGQTGSGKALTVDTVIPTPTGPKRMGDINLNDYVYNRLGTPTKVTGVFPQGKKQVYEVVLSDGRKVLCNDEHLWTYVTEDGSFETKALKDLVAGFYIPVNKALNDNVISSKSTKEEAWSLGYIVENGTFVKRDKIKVVEVNDLKREDEMVCIMVDNEEHLFLANDFVVTHNTEFQKALISYIPDKNKISLMEDTLDSHIKKIYPKKDINSWATSGEKGDANYIGFPALIRSGLRNNPDWLMISEVRGSEAQDLLSAALTGHSIMTTLHATGADNIPSRLSNMVATGSSSINYEALQLDIVSVLNLGVHLHMKIDKETGKISREIREIFEYTDFINGQGIIGRPIFERKLDYDPDTDVYSETVIKKRLSDVLLKKITNERLIHEVPDIYKDGEYDD